MHEIKQEMKEGLKQWNDEMTESCALHTVQMGSLGVGWRIHLVKWQEGDVLAPGSS